MIGLVQELRQCACRRYSEMIDTAKCTRSSPQRRLNIKVAINFPLVKTLTRVRRLHSVFFHAVFLFFDNM